MASETEKYLLDKLVLAQKAAQGREDCLSKFPCIIQKHFENVIRLLGQAENGDLSESSRRGDLYHLCNALANWQMVLERKGVYSLGGIRFLITLNSKLKKMESRLKGTTSGGVTRQEGDIDEKIIMNECHDRWSCGTVDRNRVFGFREKENFMERFLIRRDNEVNGFKAICISGVAGVGKTTLCQLTFNNEQVMKNFFPRIWVCMSKSPEVTDDDYQKEVLNRMLKCIGVEDQVIKFTGETRGVVGLLFALRSVLKGTRYLIVLDDTFYTKFFVNLLRSEPELLKANDGTKTLALGLPKQQGGAVIVTTRSNEELGKKMVNKDNVYPLLPLCNKSCLEILKDSAGEKVKQLLKDQTDDDLEDTIMSKLGGLPLAAKIMGTIMKQQLDRIPEN
ncbi:probable disease resistance protein At4g19060 [Solanum verrucosum]|uniref:probable disease resistance protein At4g19060 n=1 Tax=Solanum verrucosum TaxID=315347 RepID=UPI0020D184E1|nr:probable disease resistance protein At4g19060 [Solanum verrucosum]